MSPTPTPRRTDTDTQPGYVSDTVRSGDDPVTVRLAAVIETLDALEDAADHTRDAIAAAVRSHGNRWTAEHRPTRGTLQRWQIETPPVRVIRAARARRSD